MRSWWRFVALYWIQRKRENLAIRVVARLPRWMVYRTIIRAAVKDEQGHPGEVTALEMLRKFENDRSSPRRFSAVV